MPTKVVHLSTNITKACEECGQSIGNFRDADFGELITHYLNHGYQLLHVGEETSWTDTHELWHSTVAVLAK